LRQLRGGELTVLLGVAAVVVSLLLPWYEGSTRGTLNAWDTFGPALVLLIVAACAGLAVIASAVTERSIALAVAAAVWTVALGLVGLIAALVRLLERPHHASALCAGAWVALAGALAILAGAWLALRDERTSVYRPADPPPRPRP
jgi:multidrug transporter EmrE-like cation transporter